MRATTTVELGSGARFVIHDLNRRSVSAHKFLEIVAADGTKVVLNVEAAEELRRLIDTALDE